MKKKSPHRNQRVSSELIKDLSKLISQEIKDPRLGFVTVQSVDLTADYSLAKVYVSVLGSPAQQKTSIDVLNEKAGLLHSLLYKIWRIHTIPTLKFIYDDTQDKGFAMDILIKEALATTSSSTSTTSISDEEIKS
jgi:ribosome-binding factor A